MGLSRLFHRRRKLAFAEYGHEVREFQMSREGHVQFAQWLHPFDQPKILAQSSVDAVRQFIGPGDFAIDIGAHTGDTTVPMGLAAGPTGCVLALEPNPHVFKVLVENAQLNGEKLRIEPRCFAATERAGTFVFHYSDGSFCNGGFKSQQRSWFYRRQYPLAVEGRNLLEVLRSEFADWLPKLSYLKVDAEGYDRAILQSLLPLLKERRPVVRTEVFRKLVSAERFALYDLLDEAGYGVHHYQYEGDSQGRRLTRGDMTREKHFDILAVPK